MTTLSWCSADAEPAPRAPDGLPWGAHPSSLARRVVQMISQVVHSSPQQNEKFNLLPDEYLGDRGGGAAFTQSRHPLLSCQQPAQPGVRPGAPSWVIRPHSPLPGRRQSRAPPPAPVESLLPSWQSWSNVPQQPEPVRPHVGRPFRCHLDKVKHILSVHLLLAQRSEAAQSWGGTRGSLVVTRSSRGHPGGIPFVW